MPREKKTRNCDHCGKEFTQARKDQKYCTSECRFNHFFERRDNEKTVIEKQIETHKARVAELEALREVAAPAAKKAAKPKALPTSA
jgi:hypothetical protein